MIFASVIIYFLTFALDFRGWGPTVARHHEVIQYLPLERNVTYTLVASDYHSGHVFFHSPVYIIPQNWKR